MMAIMVVTRFHVQISENHMLITRQRLVERGVAADALVPTWCDQHQVTKIIGSGPKILIFSNNRMTINIFL